MNHCRNLLAVAVLAFSGMSHHARKPLVAHLNIAFENPINDVGELKAVIGLLPGAERVTLDSCRILFNSAKA